MSPVAKVTSLLAAALFCLACDSQPAAPAASYTVRGKVNKLMDQGTNRPLAMIHHEAIDSFKDRQGKQVGMVPMEMSFTYDEAKLADVLQAGKAVEFTFEVRWSDSPPLRITSAKALPDGTALQFGDSKHGNDSADDAHQHHGH